MIGAVRVGYAAYLGGRAGELAGGAMARHSRLQGDGFLSEYGVQAEYSFAGGDEGRWSVSAEAVNQDFQGALRDGGRYEAALTYRGAPSSDLAWVAGAAIEFKDAELSQLGYRGGRLFGAVRRVIADNGTYIAGSGVLRFARFDDAPLPPDLHETRSFVRVAVGMPIVGENLFIEAAVTHSARRYNRDSGLHNFSSGGAELRLIYRFGQ